MVTAPWTTLRVARVKTPRNQVEEFTPLPFGQIPVPGGCPVQRRGFYEHPLSHSLAESAVSLGFFLK